MSSWTEHPVFFASKCSKSSSLLKGIIVPIPIWCPIWVIERNVEICGNKWILIINVNPNNFVKLHAGPASELCAPWGKEWNLPPFLTQKYVNWEFCAPHDTAPWGGCLTSLTSVTGPGYMEHPVLFTYKDYVYKLSPTTVQDIEWNKKCFCIGDCGYVVSSSRLHGQTNTTL